MSAVTLSSPEALADAPERRNRLRDLRGLARVAAQATLGVTGVVEDMHHDIARTPRNAQDRPRGLTAAVYRTVRTVMHGVAVTADAAIGLGERWAPDSPVARWQWDSLAALNGVIGDRLAAAGNPLAFELALRHRDRPLSLEPAALARQLTQPRSRLLVMIHGLCMHDAQWRRAGHHHGDHLAARFGLTPIQVRYNSGRAIGENAVDLDRALSALMRAWPVPVTEITLLGHSMGGLVARGALQVASEQASPWLAVTPRVFFLGTPHAGAPLERIGHGVDELLRALPYTGALARLGAVRSAGITDLRHGRVLPSHRAAPGEPSSPIDRAHPPLPASVRGFAIAASLSPATPRRNPLQAGWQAVNRRWIGDGLVPVRSALGEAHDPRRRLAIAAIDRAVVPGIGHFDLLESAQVAELLVHWMREDRRARR